MENQSIKSKSTFVQENHKRSSETVEVKAQPQISLGNHSSSIKVSDQKERADLRDLWNACKLEEKVVIIGFTVTSIQLVRT